MSATRQRSDAHEPAFQDLLGGNHCFGCGRDNPGGLRLKSRWTGEREAECRFRPEPHMAAAPSHVVNGGILATAIDCHAVCTAIADAHRRSGRPLGEAPAEWYATGALDVRYRRPAPMGAELVVRARVEEASDRRTVLRCTLEAGGDVCAEGTVTAVRVPLEWMERTPTAA